MQLINIIDTIRKISNKADRAIHSKQSDATRNAIDRSLTRASWSIDQLFLSPHPYAPQSKYFPHSMSYPLDRSKIAKLFS